MEYSLEYETLGLATSAAMANSVVVVKQAMTGDLAGMNWEPQWMMQWIVQLSRAYYRYCDSISSCIVIKMCIVDSMDIDMP